MRRLLAFLQASLVRNDVSAKVLVDETGGGELGLEPGLGSVSGDRGRFCGSRDLAVTEDFGESFLVVVESAHGGIVGTSDVDHDIKGVDYVRRELATDSHHSLNSRNSRFA
jgi:hypothetical protein